MALASYYNFAPAEKRNIKTEFQFFHNFDHKMVVAIVPAFNEGRSIRNVVLNMRRYVNTVLVVDDGSGDETAEIAREAGAIVVKHSQNQGKGAALSTGFREACKLNPDMVVTIDADGQHLPEETRRVITPLLAGEADLVVGSRYLQHTSHIPQHRVWGHRLFNLILNQISGIPLTDSQSGFRAFSAKALRAISFESHGFAVESEMQFLARKFNLRVAEVPITVRYEEPAKRSVIMQGLLVLAGVLSLTASHRPLLCSNILGTLLLLLGLIGGLWLPDIYPAPSETNLVQLAAAFPFTILGVSIFLTGLIVHTRQPLLRLLFSKER